MSVEVESSDVLRLIMQFLRENNLTTTLQSLEEESQISLNTVDSVEAFVADIHSGTWDIVLQNISNLRIPYFKLAKLYEQVVIEFFEIRETDVCRALMKESSIFAEMKKTEPERFTHLELLINKPYFDTRDAYPDGMTKEGRRNIIAEELAEELAVVPPSRLLTLLSQSIRFQQQKGVLPPGKSIDLLRGIAATTSSKEVLEIPPDAVDTVIKFGKKVYPECAIFSADGVNLITGSADGFVEVWDMNTGKLRKDLKYQAEDKFMMHDATVLCVALSRDSELLATGDAEGNVKIWKLRTGQCVRKLEHAHSKGVTSVQFSRDGSQLLSSSFDGLGRLHGLKSTRVLREYRGHTSYVNSIIQTTDGTKVVTASSDGSVKVWDAKTTECLSTFRPSGATVTDVTVLSVHTIPNNPNVIFVATQTNKCYLFNLQGKVIRTYELDNDTIQFVSCLPSPRGGFIYGYGDDGYIYCFKIDDSSMVRRLHSRDAEEESIGIAVHPSAAVIASFANNGLLKLWSPR
eukprot:TRINITY_DN25920_c0_g1_i1.p1 TRINITY_DN25920_c0_g1~~TRINITY_DN25920_c0_g1_i1.p1  ORF type:complete len:517 (+),score=124.55 TRINITY_DN25920_c0_g1_i1:90-1640(+)